MTNSFPKHAPQVRNLDIFWAATLEGVAQAELASRHGISQQRVSQIVRSVRQFVALASSEQYEGVPQQAQLQLGCRIQLEKLKRRRRAMVDAWEASTRPSHTVKHLQSQTHGERIETVEKSQHGDWRIDRQLGQIDQAVFDTTVLLYERPWFGRAEAEAGRKAEGGRGKREQRVRREELSTCAVVEAGEEDAGRVEEVCSGTELVLGTEYSVPSTECVPETCAEPLVVPAESPSPESAICNPQSPIATEPAAEQPVKRMWRAEPICDLTGRRIAPPIDEHRPWRRVWLSRAELQQLARGATPQGVLLNALPEFSQTTAAEPKEYNATYDAVVPWDEVERHLGRHLGTAELVGAP